MPTNPKSIYSSLVDAFSSHVAVRFAQPCGNFICTVWKHMLERVLHSAGPWGAFAVQGGAVKLTGWRGAAGAQSGCCCQHQGQHQAAWHRQVCPYVAGRIDRPAEDQPGSTTHLPAPCRCAVHCCRCWFSVHAVQCPTPLFCVGHTHITQAILAVHVVHVSFAALLCVL